MQNDNSPLDSELLAAAARGDEYSAARLYHRYANLIYRICFRVLPDESQAKDCAQEVWLKVFKNQQRFRADSSFRSWITTIAVNCTIDWIRKYSRIVPVSENELVTDMLFVQTETARQQLEEEKIQRSIRQALGRMSVQQRVSFVLRHYEGESLANIAQFLQCSEGTVKTHIHRAVVALRQVLSEYQTKR